MTADVTLKNWSLSYDEQAIAWLTFDRQDASTNTLNAQVLNELSTVLKHLKDGTKGLVITSGKSNGFIAGADIHQFVQFRDIEEARELLELGHTVFDELAALPVTTVVTIDGFCLGGGLELALACDYRVVSDSPKTKLGLPEVKLGIIPGWGGSVRLPRLVGPLAGLDLILKGKMIPGKVAKKIGLADYCVAPYHMHKAATLLIEQTPPRRKPRLMERIANMGFVRPFVAKMINKSLRKHIRPEHYPAPFKAVETWQRNGAMGKQAFEDEKQTAGELFLTDTSKNLVRLFFLQDRLKGLGDSKQYTFKHVHVVGAGAMGAGIATMAAHAGCVVTVQDRAPKYLAPAVKHAAKVLKRLNRAPERYRDAMDRFIPDPQGYGVATADIIIEAIFENEEAKQDLFKSLEQRAKPDAVLATNTSSIPLDVISKVMQNPGRLVGIHFFNPVDKMQLVEIVHSPRTDEKVVEAATAFVHHINKLPLPVKSKPGFLINRILMPYLLESVMLYESGLPGEVIDEAAVRFGMPMGPVTLADTVGLDICHSVIGILKETMEIEMPESLDKKVKAGECGMKSGQGYYTFKKGKPVKKSVDISKYDIQEIQDRLIYVLLNECIACLEEEIVSDGDLLDAGMIFGTGFAPFRGGPVHYANTLGFDSVNNRFKSLNEAHGKRFKLKGKLEVLESQPNVSPLD